MTDVKWYTAIVLQGTKHGRTIGFPTVNLDPTILDSSIKQGIYVSQVSVGNKTYTGALYYGPRLVKGETFPILEVHIIDFSGDLYGKSIKFRVGKYIREVRNFSSLDLMRKQLQEDISTINLEALHI